MNFQKWWRDDDDDISGEEENLKKINILKSIRKEEEEQEKAEVFYPKKSKKIHAKIRFQESAAESGEGKASKHNETQSRSIIENREE